MRSFPAPRTHAARLLAALLLVASGCGPNPVDETDNLLPTQDGDGAGEEEVGTGGPTMGVPATYRFTCMDVRQLGSADGDSFQAGLMESTWSGDIDGFKLNLLVDFLTLDAAAGTGELKIRSGRGTNSSNQCSEANSDSDTFPATFQPDVSAYGPLEEDGTCSQATATGDAFGTFQLDLTSNDLIYIYAEDNSGQSFNCTEDPSPDAVPIRAVSATFTLSADEQVAYGNLTACMVETEAENLCACLGACTPQDPPDPKCDGCNPDAVPLATLLIGVTTSEPCTTLMGVPAFDVEIGFVAERLPGVPARCD